MMKLGKVTMKYIIWIGKIPKGESIITVRGLLEEYFQRSA